MPSGSPDRLSPESVVMIFKACSRQFPNKFREMASDIVARDVWLRQLRAEGITDAMVAQGLSSQGFRRLEWPPSMGEFIKFCRPTAEELGLPSPALARQQILHARGLPGDVTEFKWVHVVVYHAYKSLNQFTNEALRAPEGKRAMDHHYSLICRRFINGERLEEPVQTALPKTAATPARTSQQKQAISDMLHAARHGSNTG